MNMTAADVFTRQLDDLAKARQHTPCQLSAARGDNPWTSEDSAERARAADMCGPCSLRESCLASALAEHTEFGVRAGHDFTDKKARAALRATTRKATE